MAHVALALPALPAVLALAHVAPGLGGAFDAGFLHPLLGTDHLLAMLAVGLLAALNDGLGRAALPLAFVTAMALGLALGTAEVALDFTETLILGSVIVLGGLLASGIALPVAAGAAVAGFFGLFHGLAHGLELGGAGPLGFALGALGATALLHLAGLALADLLLRLLGRPVASLPLRMMGAGLGLGGLSLAVPA